MAKKVELEEKKETPKKDNKKQNDKKQEEKKENIKKEKQEIKQEENRDNKESKEKETLKEKFKKWDKKQFFKTLIRNFLILLIIMYLIYIMMNTFLETARITNIPKGIGYLKYVDDAGFKGWEWVKMTNDLIRAPIQGLLLSENTLYSLMIFFGLFFCLKSITGNSKASCLIILIFELFYEILNYVVMYLRGGGITLADVYSIRTAVNVIDGMKIHFDKYFVIGVFIFIITLVVILKVKITENKPKIWQRFAFFVLGCILIVIPAKNVSVNLWNITEIYRKQGTPITIVEMIENSRLEKPEGYNAEEVKNILKEYEKGNQEEVITETDKPNIIAIMNESFSDIYTEHEVGKEDPIPYYRELITKEDVISGTMYTSEIGGGTANVEYEFLTQNTTAFLPVGTLLYQQYSLVDQENLVQTLKNLGYQTSAIHTWYKSGYSREKVYRLFGFEQVDFYDNLKHLEITFNNDYPTDQATYEEIIKQFNERDKEKPYFNFTVTMQNHQPYNTESETKIKYSDDPEINCYLQLINDSDEALKYLIEELEKEEEKVILLLFGDHQPKLQNVDTGLDDPETYKVPFFIWANYDIEEAFGKELSANYLQSLLIDVAGLPETTYTKYMSEMQKTLPVITEQFYKDSTGKLYKMEDTSSQDFSKIQEYQKVVYYKMFEK